MHSFRGIHYQSVGDGYQIEDADDIGEIVDMEEGDLQENRKREIHVDGVLYNEELL